MIRTQSWDEAQTRRIVRDAERFKGTRVPLIDSEPGMQPAPRAYVIEQQPQWVVDSHYHRAYQFQLIAAGSGFIGRNPVEPYMVHYASPESGYGPLVAGPRGLSYYTLRATQDDGAFYLPESRDLMRKDLKKQHAMSQPVHAGDPARLKGAMVEETLPLSAEGMAAWRVGLPPDASMPAADLNGQGARYYFVAAGSMVADGKPLDKGSVCFVHGEPGFRIEAGAQGLEVLVMQFPEAATAV